MYQDYIKKMENQISNLNKRNKVTEKEKKKDRVTFKNKANQ